VPVTGHRLLIKIDEAEEVTKGGIIIAKTIQERQTEANIFGTLVAIGVTAWLGFDNGDPWAEVGDRVAVGKYVGFVIEDPTTLETFRLVNDNDLIAIIK